MKGSSPEGKKPAKGKKDSIPSGKKKAPDKKRLIQDCDTLFSQFIRLRDGKCCVCGKADRPLFCHHIFTRRIYALRWFDKNGVAICWACHRHVAHEHPEKFRDIIMNKIGEEQYLELKRMAYAAPGAKHDYVAIKARLIKDRQDLICRQAEELF
jgi:5-methylcytosine-specific restriction endonuclease McrA